MCDRVDSGSKTFGVDMFSTRFRAVSAGLFLLFPSLALAQSTPATQADIKALQDSIHTAQMNADNSWMLVSSALVLLMTGPGLALFYGGLVRRKNILGTMMQSFAMMGLVTILWAVVG